MDDRGASDDGVKDFEVAAGEAGAGSDDNVGGTEVCEAPDEGVDAGVDGAGWLDVDAA